MPPSPIRENQYLRTLLPDPTRDLQPVLPGVLDAPVGNIECCAPRNFQNARSFGRLACPVFSRAAGAHFTFCQVQDAGAVSALGHLEQSAAAGLLDIVTMRGESENVESVHS